MNLFEMTFHVEHVDDGLVDMLIDDYEATTGTDHTGHEFVTVLAEGDSFDHAARTMVTELQSHGLRILRLVPDLLTRSEIAARLDEEMWGVLDAPVLRVAAWDTHYPPARTERAYLPDAERVLDALDRSFTY